MTDLPVVWLSEDTPSRDAAARALAEWARARGVTLTTPPPAKAPIAADPRLAEAVEKELAQALGADDDEAASRSLARADAVLREHPELPAAPMLRAEVLRGWARLYLRRGDEAAAAAAWQDAEALDGGRVAGIGEKRAAAPPAVSLTIRARGDVTIDGRPPTGQVLPGEHVVVSRRDGVIVDASWLAVRGPLDVTLPSPEDTCSLPAFEAVKRDGDHVVANGVACDAWVAAAEAADGVLVARCTGSACSSFVEWRHARRDVFVPIPADRSKAPLPAWATWTVVGISAATIASVVLVAAGVFESRPVETRFVLGGSRQE